MAETALSRRVWSERQLRARLEADEASGGGPALQTFGAATIFGDVTDFTAATDFADGASHIVAVAADPSPQPWLDVSGFIQAPGLYRIGALVSQSVVAADGTKRFWITRTPDPMLVGFSYGDLAVHDAAADFLLSVTADNVIEGTRAALLIHSDADDTAVIHAQPYVIALALTP